MSTLSVNSIESSVGGVINIPSGYSLSVDGIAVNANSLPPTPNPTNSNKALHVSDSGILDFSTSGPKSIQTFNSSGTWNKPSGISKVLVQLVGGGGAASSYGESGGAGGFAEKLIDVTSISSVTVTVGLGSTAYTSYSGAAGQGGTSSFGSYLSATGGRGANTSFQHCGGLPGVGSGGDLNIYGGGGSGHSYYGRFGGGDSFFGGGGAAGHPQGGYYAYNNRELVAAGGGGSAGYHYYSHGATGKNGIIIVYEYA